MISRGVYTARQQGNEVIESATFKSSVARLRNAVDYHLIEIGVQRGEGFDLIGSWDQRQRGIVAGEPLSVTGNSPINWPIYPAEEGLPADEIVVRVTRVGRPASLQSANLQINTTRVGEVQPSGIPRLDGGTLEPNEVTRSLFGGGPQVEDGPTRTAIASVQDALNQSGVLDNVIVVDLATFDAGPLSLVDSGYTTWANVAMVVNAYVVTGSVRFSGLDPQKRYKAQCFMSSRIDGNQSLTWSHRVRLNDGSLLAINFPVGVLMTTSHNAGTIRDTSASPVTEFEFTGLPTVEVQATVQQNGGVVGPDGNGSLLVNLYEV